jgi:hypothetical protein
MKQLTADIKLKIKEEAIKRLQDGNALLVVDKDELKSYIEILEDGYLKSTITFPWEIN